MITSYGCNCMLLILSKKITENYNSYYADSTNTNNISAKKKVRNKNILFNLIYESKHNLYHDTWHKFRAQKSQSRKGITVLEFHHP